MLETLEFLAVALGGYAVLATLLSAPLWFLLRRRLQFSQWDIAVVYVPWLIWLAVSNFMPKSFSNVLVETLLLAAVAPLAAIVHLALSRRTSPSIAGRVGVVLVSAIGIAVAWLVPPMGE